MKTFAVVTENDKGDEIVLKRTEKYEEAVDYLEQCQRGSLRYASRNPMAKVNKFKLYEVV